MLSTDDVFHGNAAQGEGFGGGLDAEADRVTALNVVATANSIDGGSGGGINIAADRSLSVLEIIHGTIVDQRRSARGRGPGPVRQPERRS